ncbi:MAG: flagellar biosynthesis protein FliQ [Proteobacteria bacterium]|nr:flagellar biosynthesis protein FliQ [Pseudomonadota bacterium]
MTSDFIVALVQESVRTTLYLAAPLLFVSMAVGLIVSIVQAATQIQEMTLVFVPKMLAVFAGVVLFASFMLDTIARFTYAIFDLVSRGGAL